MAAVRVHITGLVQGVFYRAQTKEKAAQLGLTGWARNTEGGGVEIHAEGPEVKLIELEQWCWKGPPSAIVESVTVTATNEIPSASFEIVE